MSGACYTKLCNTDLYLVSALREPRRLDKTAYGHSVVVENLDIIIDYRYRDVGYTSKLHDAPEENFVGVMRRVDTQTPV